MQIVWLPRAISTRKAQLEFIADKNPRAAVTQGEEVERQVDQLEEQPGLGRPGRVKGTRELVISKTKFIVVFRVKAIKKRIELMRVIHSSQSYP